MKKWWKYIRPYKLYFILGPLCMIVEVIGDVFMPMFLNLILKNSASHSPSYSIIMMGLIILTAIVMMASGVGGAYFGTKASVNFASDVRNDVYRKVQEFSFSNVDKYSTASLVTRLTNDVNQMQNFINMLLRMMLRAPGMLIGAIIMALTISRSLSAVFLIVIPVMLTVIVLIVIKGFPRFGILQKKIDSLNSTVQENITNVRVVKSFVREDKENDKFEHSNKELKKSGMSAMNIMILMQPVMTLFMYGTTIAVIWVGSKMIVSGAGAPGAFDYADLASFITYVTQILMSLIMTTMVLMMSSRAMASAKRIREVLDEEVDIKNLPDVKESLYVESGKVEFKNVTFRYHKTSTEPVLNNVNLTIDAGSTVGIIGSTGCGKTTLVSMIPRLYDVDEGEILVDGINVKDYPLYNLREGVGMVLQKSMLFSGTIEENLRWGNEKASMDEIYAAAENAQADKFVKNFTNGYATELGQGGVNVSGGQKQRLCIARTLLKNPKIIILDDSTSAVDTATEAQIRKTFTNELAGSTKIIIAQRISSVMDADKIIVMNDGVITGVGTHNELMENNQEYIEIYNSQTGKKEA